ncbi:flagellar assembly protein FliW [Niallia sp. 01092]|uniref:flagellar assembly protein FliW n=1 Tax=unclassified Niallia TaxID=2837522 RepID=UPI003FD066BA
MKIDTKYHGKIAINQDEILSFTKGIPGFPDETQFIILPLSDDGGFAAMQSAKTASLAFVISNPFDFDPTYDIELDNYVIEVLEIKEEKDVVVYSILTVQDPFEKTTANFQAPIIINAKNNQAMQVILNNSNYETKHPIFPNKMPISSKG